MTVRRANMVAMAKSSTTARTNYDSDVTPELREFMKGGWADRVLQEADPAAVAPYAAKRRQRLSDLYPGQAIVVPAGRSIARSNDTFHPFRPSSDHVWLTGSHEEAGVLVMRPTGKRSHDATLYLWPPSDRSTEAFYRDRDRGALWVGDRPTLTDVATTLGIATKPLTALPKALQRLQDKNVPVRRLRGADATVDAALPRSGAKADTALVTALHELRLVKDDVEINELALAVRGTKLGFDDVLGELPVAGSERWLEGTFFRRARFEGNYVGYGSIVACGDHACTLHWTQNDGAVRAGDLALLDMGVEACSLYTADVTRTIPINGTFSPTQRLVYEAVLDAQIAGIQAVRAGHQFMDPNVAAMRVLTRYLVEWGILHGDFDDLLRGETYRRYTLHNVSHMLGLDVHDCAQARNETYKGGPLQVGMVLTVEPGLYFQRDDLTVPEAFRGIGIRIEDDVVVTDGEALVLSADIPKQADDVEQWITACQQRSATK